MADPTASSESPRSRWGLDRSRLTRIVAGAAALIYAVIFIALNRSRVLIHFLFFTVTSRLWVGFLVCLALGAILGQAVGIYRKRHGGRTHRSTERDEAA
jgi:uncharacterized integral membrane protein